MSEWETVTLGDVAEIVSGGTPKTGVTEYWGGPHAWATPADLTNLNSVEIDSTERTLTDAGISSSAARLLPAGSVLFSSRAPIGHIAITTKPMATNQGFKSFIPTPRLNARFLYWWLDANRNHLKSLGTGATFKEVSKKVVSGVPISLPSEQEQRRIASILDRADTLRTKRRAQLAHLDEFPLSLLHEALTNAEWPRQTIGSLGTITTGKTPPTSRQGMFGGSMPFITPGDLESNSPPERTLTTEGAQHSRTVGTGATLVCCIGAIGKTGRTAERSAFNQQINAIEWGDRIDDIFGFFLMKSMSSTIAFAGTSTTLPLLPKGRFAELKVPTPSLDIQKNFAHKVVAIHAERDRVARALEADRELFAALQQRAFRGEL